MSVERISRLLPDGLVRDMEHAKIAGVCAGLAGYFGVKTKFVRLLFILVSVFGFFLLALLIYVALAMIMPQAPAGFAYGSFDAQGRAAPHYENLHDHFSRLDKRLAHIEAWVTSDDYRLRQKFRDL